MYKSVNEYLDELGTKLKGCDPALIQDALSDAEEHLRIALSGFEKTGKKLRGSVSLNDVIEQYGSPDEVATAYRDMEARRTLRKIPVTKALKPRSVSGVFKILSDSQAWCAFLYMLLGIVTGGFYGIWTLIGASLSAFSLIFIIGIPVTGLFLLSLRGIALMEGRIVEALLGQRMPRKPLFVNQELGWKDKFVALVTEPLTWKIFVYLIFQFPLGALYSFTTFIMFALSLKSILYPLWNLVFHRALFNFSTPFYPPVWSFPLVILAGCMLLLFTLHLSKFVGNWHSRYAKAMLVRK